MHDVLIGRYCRDGIYYAASHPFKVHVEMRKECTASRESLTEKDWVGLDAVMLIAEHLALCIPNS